MSSFHRASRATSWQERLEELCRSNAYRDPVYNIISDRRGGRTAWSATVSVAGSPIPYNPTMLASAVQARFWYDGAFIENAKEDAAEVAMMLLSGAGSRNGTTSSNATTSSSSNGGAASGVTSR